MNTQKQIEQIEKKLNLLKEKLKQEQNKPEFVKIKLSTGVIEVERKLHTEMDYLSKIEIPEGMRLLTLSEFTEIWNYHRDNLDYGDKLPDEVVGQPILENKKEYPYWNVWFWDLGDWSELDGFDRNLSYNSRVRGVRFCRDLKTKKQDYKKLYFELKNKLEKLKELI